MAECGASGGDILAAKKGGVVSWITAVLAFWAAAWGLNVWLSNHSRAGTRAFRLAVPVIFGVTILVVW